ncbi:MAG TPA: endolytic transglycosylase MltG [Candidatus Paceibacterota bacterium]|nr:endolytic transglycosylase MltG [Candidatus Paceibacterota bacterium]
MQFRSPRYSIKRFFVRWGWKLRRRAKTYFIALALVIGFLYFTFMSAPFGFPVGAYVNIPQGTSLGSAAHVLQEKQIIRNEFLFKVLVRLIGSEKHIVAGEYFFPRRGNVFTMAWRFGSGDFNITPTRVRIPEGATVKDIGKILADSIPNFNHGAFMYAAQGKEGYLFPDTYFFMPGQGVEEIMTTFTNNFSKQVGSIQSKIDAFGKPISEVIVMASLLEREAPRMEDRRIIAGILWKRIRLGMPLQVDAVFPYIMGKNSFDLTRKDLQFDSPYNTYLYKGLPPGAIANPGLEAILAAVTPVQSEYLFYLSDKSGNMHYSATHDQHVSLKNRYLR